MSKRKQRIVLEGFTFTVNKFIIEQESEADDDLSLQDSVRQAVGRMISAPAQLLAIEANGTVTPTEHIAPQDLSTPEPSKKRRRRRRQAEDVGFASGSDETQEGKLPSRSSAKQTGARGLILEIHQEGFFAQDRTIGDVRDKLHTRGHSYKSNELSPVLLSLTKAKTLSRRKDDKGTWNYRDGAHGKH